MFHISGIAIVVFSFCVQFSMQISLNEYLSLNQEQKLKLDEFRKRIVNQVPHDYMRKDVFLIRWLRNENFDVDDAVEKLSKHISWRETNRIDSILKEDWSDFDHEIKINFEGCDLDSKPVLSLPVGDWDLRRYIIQGKTKQFIRYMDKILEEAEVMLRRMQESGANVTQTTFIYELNNFNIVQQGCAQCIPIYIYFLTSYEKNYSGLVHKVYIVNTPRIAIPIWEVLRGFLSPRTRDVLEIYGKDKAEWSSILGKEIHPSQLTRQFGGFKKESTDFQDFRATGDIIKCSTN